MPQNWNAAKAVAMIQNCGVWSASRKLQRSVDISGSLSAAPPFLQQPVRPSGGRDDPTRVRVGHPSFRARSVARGDCASPERGF